MKKIVLCEKTADGVWLGSTTLDWVREGLSREVTFEPRTEWPTKKKELWLDKNSFP